MNRKFASHLARALPRHMKTVGISLSVNHPTLYQCFREAQEGGVLLLGNSPLHGTVVLLIRLHDEKPLQALDPAQPFTIYRVGEDYRGQRPLMEETIALRKLFL